MEKTVLIADRYNVAIKGTSFILKKISKNILIDFALDKNSLIDKVSQYDYDILILDIEMLDTFFESTIKNLKDLNPNLKIMIFTGGKKEISLQYVCEGVDAVISKLYDESILREGFESFFNKGYYYHPELLYDFINTTKVISSFSRSGLEILSDRERTVYFYLVKGKGLLEIANELGLHQSTVSIYKRRLFKKLNVTSLAQLINLYNKYGLSTPDGTVSL
ncbi:DNA-binding response regulator [Chryseobacterium nematophagum]|uniref:DNA-binding response regulator n=1 Tax=Chryseobacterium nematophagum TaxID=2305228 RepID=A0A3M7TEK3_9FLAO|nr:response regulator transcription factor [Chryseobacterium nematophagum]RNA61079.1 DNA-binding response regulator [Chryseobacterium nematophagum]